MPKAMCIWTCPSLPVITVHKVVSDVVLACGTKLMKLSRGFYFTSFKCQLDLHDKGLE